MQTDVLRFLVLALVSVVDVCQSITILANKDKSSLLTPAWIENVSSTLSVNDGDHDYFSQMDLPNPANPHHAVVVTFAGKKNTEYIDGAVMLGISVQQNLPNYPMAAIIIEGMKSENQNLLKEAGWKLITVPNWDSDYCGEGCDMEFLGRWHDSFEKINAFRLPFKRVLFMDADTFIFRSHVKWLVTQMKLPSEDHIAMARDGCKDEYNSGVMFFKPDLKVFRSMLTMVSQRRREQILDQNLINSYYSGKIFEIDRTFNCVDTVGIQPGRTKPCEQHCSWNATVSHFTGHPKPTSAKKRLLELVRRPGSPALACMHTNFGSCGKWSEYYCEIRTHSNRLSTELQTELGSMGRCCHSSMVSRSEARWARRHGKWKDETCLECPATMKIWAPNPNLTNVAGSYMKTTIPSRKFNGGRPIYINRDRDMKNAPVYMFFLQEQLAWAIGANYKSNSVYGFAGQEAQCPRDSSLWLFHNGTGFERKKLNIRKGHNWHHAPNDTDHIVWNIHRRKWEREKIFWDHGHLATLGGGHDDSTGGENDTENATDNEETVVENGTNDSVEEDDKNAAENEDTDDSENETSESGDEKDNNATDKDVNAAEHETTESGEKDEKNVSDIKGDEAPSGEEMNGIQLVPFVLQSCVRLFKRVVGLLQG